MILSKELQDRIHALDVFVASADFLYSPIEGKLWTLKQDECESSGRWRDGKDEGFIATLHTRSWLAPHRHVRAPGRIAHACAIANVWYCEKHPRGVERFFF